MALLARREHTQAELIRKLQARGFDETSVRDLVDALSAAGLQSDARFTESYVNHRIEKGYGPLHIRQALRQRGVDDHLIDQFLDMNDPDWIRRAADLLLRRHGTLVAGDRAARARAGRFLQQRGFSGEQVYRVLSDRTEC